MNFEATFERIARLNNQTAFNNLAKSKKRKDPEEAAREIEAGRKKQDIIRKLLVTLQTNGLYKNRAAFEADLDAAATRDGVKLRAPIKKAIFAALGEPDLSAEICLNSNGQPEPDGDLRDTENIPLPEGTQMPLPMSFGPDKSNEKLVDAFREVIDAYMVQEVLPHVPDAWVDYEKTKIAMKSR